MDMLIICILKIKKNDYRWSCAQRKQLLCKSVVNTTIIDDRHHIKKSPVCHNHDPIAHLLPISKCNNSLKEMGSTSGLKPSQIIRKSIVDCQPDCRVYIPSKRAQKLKISRIRKSNEAINEPQSLSDIIIPEILKYLEGDLFVLKETTFNDNKNIILGTSASLKTLGSCKCWVMDGTFYIVPTIFRQLFTIQGLIAGQFVPLIFCLMSKKTMEAYNDFFIKFSNWRSKGI